MSTRSRSYSAIAVAVRTHIHMNAFCCTALCSPTSHHMIAVLLLALLLFEPTLKCSGLHISMWIMPNQLSLLFSFVHRLCQLFPCANQKVLIQIFAHCFSTLSKRCAKLYRLQSSETEKLQRMHRFTQIEIVTRRRRRRIIAVAHANCLILLSYSESRQSPDNSLANPHSYCLPKHEFAIRLEPLVASWCVVSGSAERVFLAKRNSFAE